MLVSEQHLFQHQFYKTHFNEKKITFHITVQLLPSYEEAQHG